MIPAGAATEAGAFFAKPTKLSYLRAVKSFCPIFLSAFIFDQRTVDFMRDIV